MGTGGNPAGWYDDGHETMRWWDGEQWTDDVMAPPTRDTTITQSASADSGSQSFSEWEPPRVQSTTRPSSAARPRIGWIVGGVVLAAAGLAAAIAVGVVPWIADRLDDPAQAGQSQAIPSPPLSPSPTATVDQAALDAIGMLDAAWVEHDCDLYFSSTTAHFRDYMTIRSCEEFGLHAEGRAEVILSNVWLITTSEQPNAITATVITHNFTESLVDADGQRVEQPILIETDYAYHLAKQGEDWKVDEVHDVSGGRTEWAVTAEEETAANNAADAWILALTAGDCGAAQAAMTLDFAARSGFASGGDWGECAGLNQHVLERDAMCEFSVEASDIVYNSRVDAHLGEILVTTVERCGGDQVVELHMVDVGDAGWRVSDVLYETTER